MFSLINQTLEKFVVNGFTFEKAMHVAPESAETTEIVPW
jgi:hypothetical protein